MRPGVSYEYIRWLEYTRVCFNIILEDTSYTNWIGYGNLSRRSTGCDSRSIHVETYLVYRYCYQSSVFTAVAIGSNDLVNTGCCYTGRVGNRCTCRIVGPVGS